MTPDLPWKEPHEGLAVLSLFLHPERVGEQMAECSPGCAVILFSPVELSKCHLLCQHIALRMQARPHTPGLWCAYIVLDWQLELLGR